MYRVACDKMWVSEAGNRLELKSGGLSLAALQKFTPMPFVTFVYPESFIPHVHLSEMPLHGHLTDMRSHQHINSPAQKVTAPKSQLAN